MLVSIVVPAYKKQRTIKRDIKNIYKVMSSTRYRFEIIVVVDGFLDKTFEKASELKLKNVKVVGYAKNHGKGFAVKYGMAKSKGDVVAFIDAGMDIDANGISMILEHMQWYKADIVVGSKRHPASKIDYPAFRKLYSFGYQLLVLALFWLKVKDTQTGLKVFRRNVLEDTMPRLLIKEFAFDIELLAVARHLGYTRIFEAPVEIYFEPDSKFDKFLFLDENIRRMLWDTLAVFYRMRILRYYDDKNKHIWRTDPELVIDKKKKKKVKRNIKRKR